MKKLIVVSVLVVVIALLAWLIWIQTKALAITLGILVVSLVVLYFVVRKM